MTDVREIEEVRAVVEPLVPPTPRVLDAGCGSRGYFDFGANARVTGIDISRWALDRSEHVDEKILGDIETYPLPEEHYDAVVCWDVLEHLRRPTDALERLLRSVAPGGLLVIAFPNVFSLKGLITKLTPHRFHVWFYRVALRNPAAGKPGGPPFRTYMRLSIAPDAVEAFAIERGFQVVHRTLYETPMVSLALRKRALRDAWAIAGATVEAVTFGKIDGRRSDVILIFAKPARREEMDAR